MSISLPYFELPQKPKFDHEDYFQFLLKFFNFVYRTLILNFTMEFFEEKLVSCQQLLKILMISLDQLAFYYHKEYSIYHPRQIKNQNLNFLYCL